MGVPFKKIARKDPRKADAVAKFYPQLVTLGDNATLDDIAYVMKEKSSLTLGDIQSVLTNFVEAMITTLYSGQSVNIKNFGVFSLSARTAGVLDVKECTAKNIKAVKINFRPSSTVRPDIAATRAGQKIDFYDLEALLNKGDGEGGSSGGGSATSLSNLQWPVPSCTLITSRFGYRVAPTTGASTYHGGLDIGAGMGASIVAAGAGDVIYAGANGGYGNCVMIDHGNGVVTVYAHMSSIGVSYGQYVTAGQYVGAVGSTGVSTGPHCHFEIRINGAQTDPAAYFSGLSYWNC